MDVAPEGADGAAGETAAAAAPIDDESAAWLAQAEGLLSSSSSAEAEVTEAAGESGAASNGSGGDGGEDSGGGGGDEIRSGGGAKEDEEWLVRVVKAKWCSVMVRVRGRSERQAPCEKVALDKFSGACCSSHAGDRYQATRVEPGTYLVSSLAGWDSRRDPALHSSHYTCNPCTVKCHSCVRGVLVRSLAFHMEKCAPRATSVADLANPEPSASFANRTQYPAGSAMLDVMGEQDRALATQATRSFAARTRRNKVYKQQYRKAKKRLNEDGFLEEWRELWPDKSSDALRPASLNMRAGEEGWLQQVRANDGDDGTEESVAAQIVAQAVEVVGVVGELTDEVVSQGAPLAPLYLNTKTGEVRKVKPIGFDDSRDQKLSIFTDHSQHYACFPCVMKCPHCGMNTVLHGYHQHIGRCGRVHAQRAATESSTRTMRVASRVQYPYSSAAIEKYNRTQGGKVELAVYKKHQETWFRARGGAGQADRIPLDIPSYLATTRREVHRSAHFEAAIQRYSEVPVALDDHDKHATCSPCTVKCPHCAWETILAGWAKHAKHCEGIQKKRALAGSSNMRATLRRQYPGQSRVLDVRELEGGKAKQNKKWLKPKQDQAGEPVAPGSSSNSAKKEQWVCHGISMGMCRIMIEGATSPCMQLGRIKFSRACSAAHCELLGSSNKLSPGPRLVCESKGWRELGDPLDHATHHQCFPCTILCVGCEKALLLHIEGAAMQQISAAKAAVAKAAAEASTEEVAVLQTELEQLQKKARKFCTRGLYTHVLQCQQRNERSAKIAADDRSLYLALKHQYPRQLRWLEEDANEEDLRLVRMRRARAQRALRRTLASVDHSEHDKCERTSKGKMICSVRCTHCDKSVLVSGYEIHVRSCADFHNFMAHRGGESAAQQQSVREGFRHGKDFGLFEALHKVSGQVRLAGAAPVVINQDEDGDGIEEQLAQLLRV